MRDFGLWVRRQIILDVNDEERGCHGGRFEGSAGGNKTSVASRSGQTEPQSSHVAGGLSTPAVDKTDCWNAVVREQAGLFSLRQKDS